MEVEPSGTIAELLTTFLAEHGPIFRRIAYCEIGREPIAVEHEIRFEATGFAPPTEDIAWERSVGFGSGRNELVVPSKEGAVVLVRIDARRSLVLDTPSAGRMGVAVVLGGKLAQRLLASGNRSMSPERT